MRSLPLVVVLAFLAAWPAPAGAAPGTLGCTGDAQTARALTLSVDGEPATGRFVAPIAAPTAAIVFAHGYSWASDGWDPHMRRLARESGALAITMDYRGLVFLGDDPDDDRPYLRSRGYPVKKGSEDLVAAAQTALARCPSIKHVVLLGTSMGGNASGMAVALKAQRPDGKPLFDYWIGVEGVYNLLELYEAATIGQAISPFVAQVKEDIEIETGGTPVTQPAAYQERTVVSRADDIAASGVKGVILIHAREDGLALYPQAQELSELLRGRSIPTDFYTVGSRGPDDDPDTTLAGYAGTQTGQAGHGSEVSENHVVIDQGFFSALGLLAGDPPPCDRDFQVEGSPAHTVTPDPGQASDACPKGQPLSTPTPPCRVPPRLKSVRAMQPRRAILVTGTVRLPACARAGARLRVIVRAGGSRATKRLKKPGRFVVLVRPARPAKTVRVRATDRGRRSPVRRASIR